MNRKKLFILLVSVLVFTGCGRSEAAKAVDAQIDALTEVTIDSKKDLEELDKAVEALSEDERASLKGKDKLDEYHSQYETIVFANEVNTLEDKINGIGDVTLQSSLKLKEVRNSYDRASDDIKNAITNYDILTIAEEKYIELEEKQKQTHAQKAIDEINKISNISLEESTIIVNARKEYNKLNSDEKKYVTNLDKLEKAEDELAEMQKACMENTQEIRDDYKDATFYMCSTYPKYINDRTFILPYITYQKNKAGMRANFSYNGREWIFWETVYLITDNGRYSISAASYDINRDVCGARDLLENYDKSLTDEDIEMFRDIAYSSNASAKFVGQYSYEFNIPEKDKLAMRDLIATYDYLNHK